MNSLAPIHKLAPIDPLYMQQWICRAISEEFTKYSYPNMMQINRINLDLKYGDIVCNVSSNCNDIIKFKVNAPKVLFFIGLLVNSIK